MQRLLSLLMVLNACVYVSDKDLAARKDRDGDGYALDEDCDDDDPATNPGADEVFYDGIDQNCTPDDEDDQDQDGFDYDVDCDDTDPRAYPGGDDAWYDGVDGDCDGTSDFDQDGDGEDATEWGGDDCDDLDAGIEPYAEEIWYDGVDQNCDERNDYDQDGDGFSVTEECDDDDAARYPDDSIEEIWYNGRDENCDGNDADQDGDGFVPNEYAEVYDWEAFNAHLATGDCWDDPNDLEGHETVDGSAVGPAEVNPDAPDTWYDGVDQDCAGDSDFDQDGDGFDSMFHADADGVYGDDCIDGAPEDDENPAGLEPAEVNPDAVDSWYDGTDQDCAGDDDFDQDADGHAAEGYGDGDDCEDTLPDVNVNAVEDCATAYDDDCDADTNDPGATGCENFYADADGDGEGDLGSASCLCEASTTYETTDASDCDDSDDDINSSADEITGDELDQDCDGSETCYADNDRDGYRTDTTKASTDTDCDDAREASASSASGDCNDTDDDINPGATEVTGDEVDSDCDDEEICYADADSDGYRTSTTVTSTDTDCDDSGEAPSTVTSGDCDDADSGVSPGDTEITGDGVDQNCDGQETCYTDADDDGYRKSSGTTSSTDTDCTDSGEGSSTDASADCKDTDATINPGATEITGDGVDQNCDASEKCYKDADNDGYGDDSLTTTVTSSDSDCADSGESTATLATDCNDSSSSIKPSATEITGDGVDQNCDGQEKCYKDADLDGYGDDSLTTTVTSASDVDCSDSGESTATLATDCDDSSSSIKPGATDTVGDGIDKDCDGTDG